MKTKIIFLLFTMLLLSACDKNQDQYIETSITILDFGPDEETKKFEIKSSMSLSILESPDWATVTKSKEGDKQIFSVTVQPNPSTESRKGRIEVGAKNSSQSQSVSLTVSQRGKVN